MKPALTPWAAAFGTALAAAFPAELGPHLVDFGPGEARWQVVMRLGGLVVGALIFAWSRRALLAADPAAMCLAARQYPLRLTRRLFWAALGASLGSVLLLRAGQGFGAALLPAVIVYLMLLLPIAGLYFATAALLRPAASAPADQPTPAGGRQPIALRLTLAVQLPVLLCALGMVLVEQTAGMRSEQAVEQYGRERHARLLERTLALLTPSAASHVLASVQSPEGVTLVEDARGRHRAVVTAADGLAARPVSRQIPLLFLMLGVVVLALIHGRWLPREITAELDAVRRALDDLDAGREPARAGRYGLRETAELARALERAMAGFEARRQALSAAAAERRASERRKALFLGHLSHELKSPLNSILGFSELLLAGIDGPLRPRQRDQLAAVWRQGESLERFILALLDATRLAEAGRAASLLTPEPTAASSLAEALRDQLRVDPTDARRVEITLEGASRCRVDLTYTARAIRLLAGLLLDRLDTGRVKVALRPSRHGVVVDVEVLEAEADPAERVALRRALRTEPGPAPDPRAGAVPATRLVMKALGEAQGSRFEALTDDESAWPRLRLHLPAA